MKRRELLMRCAKGTAVIGIAPMLSAKLLASDLPADITALSASNLSVAIRARQVSCVEAMQAYLKRIHRYNPTYNAIVNLAPDDTLLSQARAADKALDGGDYWGWMHGMPHAVKDLTDVQGMITTSGSPIYVDRVADSDGVIAAAVRSHGAIFIGKTNTPEFGLGSQSYNTVFGATASAYDPNLTAGGSSGGAACGLATQMLPVADGSDMMGSLRNPGAFNNVIGFRPTIGRIAAGDPFYQRLATSGPMGRNTEDTIRLLKTISGPDLSQPHSLTDLLPSAEQYTAKDLKGVRIGWLGDFEQYLAMESGVLDLCEANLHTLESAGAIVERCMPQYDMSILWKTWLDLRHWSRISGQELYNDPATRELLKPEYIWEIENSFRLTAKEIFDAGNARAQWYAEVNNLLDQYDFLMQPTSQVFPFDKTVHWPKDIAGRKMDTYHRWMEVVIGGSLAGVPVANVPAGFDVQGRPMGMQVLGRFGEDQKVLEFAMAYEAATGHLERRPTLVG